MSESFEAISVERRGAVALVTLERPDRRNLLDRAIVGEIVAAFDSLEQDDEVRAIVVTGRGPSFCAGADLGTLETGATSDFLAIYEGFLRVARSTLPTLAAVNGPAVGAGLNLALCCDVRFVTPSARFISRFPTLGLHPGGGHGWMLLQTAGPELAAAMLLYGHELTGQEIVDARLALRHVGDEELLDAAVEFAARAASVPKPLAAKLKETLKAQRALGDQDAAVSVELEAQAWSREQPFFVEQMNRFRSRPKKGS
jgi:enoyl-CoA hydratase